MATSGTPTMLSLDTLRTEFPGRVSAPGDAEYDQARAVLMGGIDKHPAVVIRVEDTSEVARVLTLARETGLELAVRCGGRCGPGTTERVCSTSPR
jgi:FAD/FMN-containing dehydrogenase